MLYPEFNGGLTNHVPMVISALKALQASEQHIEAYQALNVDKMKPVDEPETLICDDTGLKSWLGQRQNFSGIVTYLSEQLKHLGTQALVERYLPILAEGISAGAMHPVIRLGYAIQDDNSEEVIQALSYWVWAYQPLPWPKHSDTTTADMADVIQHLLDDVDWSTERIGSHLKFSLITDEFDAVVKTDAYQKMAIHPKDTNQITLEALETLAASALWMHDDFTLLHGVTGLHAIRVISSVADVQSLLLPMWRTLVVAWLSKGLRWENSPLAKSALKLSLNEMINIARQGTRDHTVKLVAVCVAEYERTGQDIYLRLAEREIMGDESLRLFL